MNEDQQMALVRFIQELTEYINSMSSAVFIPNNTKDLLEACQKVESEFGQ